MSVMAMLRPLTVLWLLVPVLLAGCELAERAGLRQPPGPVIPVDQAQAALSALGYRPGPVDGVLGPRTTAAVERFRADEGLPPGPIIDEAFANRIAERLAFAGHTRRSARGARRSSSRVAPAAARSGPAEQAAPPPEDAALRAFLRDWERRSELAGVDEQP